MGQPDVIHLFDHMLESMWYLNFHVLIETGPDWDPLGQGWPVVGCACSAICCLLLLLLAKLLVTLAQFPFSILQFRGFAIQFALLFYVVNQVIRVDLNQL